MQNTISREAFLRFIKYYLSNFLLCITNPRSSITFSVLNAKARWGKTSPDHRCGCFSLLLKVMSTKIRAQTNNSTSIAEVLCYILGNQIC